MKATWRWFGPSDPIKLNDIRQTGATGVVTALHEVPTGEVWNQAAIQGRKALIERAGLDWSVVESVPVSEAIKQGLPDRDTHIERYCETLANLGAQGIDTVCYNFMPVLDWTRTELAWPLPSGATALRFDATACAAFDLFLLKRPGADQDYDPDTVARAKAHVDNLTHAQQNALIHTLIAGLPGAEEHYTLSQFRSAIAAYDGIDHARLRDNLAYFLRAVVPAAEAAGVRLAIHPDDPPYPLFGLPRIVSTADDVAWLLDAAPSPNNGMTLCTGSYGVRADNNLVAMAARFGPNIHFAHLRSTRRERDGRSFHEADHLDGDVDMVGVIQALLTEERRRNASIPMRPDHGHHMLDDLNRSTRPGYPLIGRLKDLAALQGIEAALKAN
ncbi:mannonate dehydratase [Larsenimonas salina]|uniref:mannonate dehydratase n=1 Tax=Larsenimonas salina TaxID=1295565 RepID=UPI002072C68B|nr:mannonate dehydratase [Larsenimonas salina]MCM5705696.1 mannonate dehydratase [Larsenimonas salina]